MALVVGGVLTAAPPAAWAVPRPAWAAPRPGLAAAPPSRECYRWRRGLHAGMRGADVAQLQTRVAGWSTPRGYVAVDGAFGARTKAALKRFQSSYGLQADGVAGSATYATLYALQDADCSPAHFAWSELDDSVACGGGFGGGRLPAAAVRANVLRVMWKLEALRHKLGDRPLLVTSGFRSVRCNRRIGGASNSQHLYGTAADAIRTRGGSLCAIARAARSAGFSGILGPGTPRHGGHVHLDTRAENRADGRANGWYWSAPRCGIPTDAAPGPPGARLDR
jgi:zinc D-Ala-D-Ala carboxypeptidase